MYVCAHTVISVQVFFIFYFFFCVAIAILWSLLHCLVFSKAVRTMPWDSHHQAAWPQTPAPSLDEGLKLHIILFIVLFIYLWHQ